MTKREEWLKKKFHGSVSLANILGEVTKPIFKDMGFVQGNIMANWHDIVGGEIAEQTLPRDVKFSRDKKTDGTLHLEVYDASSLRIQHMEPIIIEKIAVYFGYKAISKIKIFQKPAG